MLSTCDDGRVRATMGGFCVAGRPGKALHDGKTVLKLTHGPQESLRTFRLRHALDFSFQLQKLSCHCHLAGQ